MLSLCLPGDCHACTSSIRVAWTSGWLPAGSVQYAGLTSKHSWTPTADEIWLLVIHSVLWDSSLPSRLSSLAPTLMPPSPLGGCFAKCLQTSRNTNPPLINALLSQARTTREATKDSLYIEAHPLGTQTTLEHKTTHFLMYTGFTCSLLVVSGVLLQLWCCTVGSHGLCSMSSKPWLYVCRAANT